MRRQTINRAILIHGLTVLLAFLPVRDAGAVPLTLRYQGQILVAGVPYEGSARFKFALVNSASTPSTWWSHDLSSTNGSEPLSGLTLPVSRGLYSVSLGDSGITGMAGIPVGVFTNDVIRLRVWFNDGTNGFQRLAPDREIGSVAFAVRSQTAALAESIPADLVSLSHLTPALRDRVNQLQTDTATLSNEFYNVHLLEFGQTRSDLTTVSNFTRTLDDALGDLRTESGELSNQFHNVHLPEFNQTRTDVDTLDSLTLTLKSGLEQIGAELAALKALNGQATFASTNPADTNLLAAGASVFRILEAAGWQNGPSGAPVARSGHAGVWTGREFIVWGGAAGGSSLLNSGAKYDPVADAWVQVSTTDAPIARRLHRAVWMGNKMFVWGGHDGTGWNPIGGQYDPQIQRWFGVPPSPLLAREDHVMLWTGDRVVIWGGRHGGGRLADGAMFDPSRNMWSSLPVPGAPIARSGAAAVWTGSELIVWGGRTTLSEVGDGARLPIANGIPSMWRPVSRMQAPLPRQGQSAVWTGSRMIVWGGVSASTFLADGASYDPLTDSWTPISGLNAPGARSGHNAVWTGTEMVILGGADQGGELSSGHAYDPATDRWRALPSDGGPLARAGAEAVWTGREILIFGGEANGAPVGALQSLDPEPPVYLFRKH